MKIILLWDSTGRSAKVKKVSTHVLAVITNTLHREVPVQDRQNRVGAAGVGWPRLRLRLEGGEEAAGREPGAPSLQELREEGGGVVQQGREVRRTRLLPLVAAAAAAASSLSAEEALEAVDDDEGGGGGRGVGGLMEARHLLEELLHRLRVAELDHLKGKRE